MLKTMSQRFAQPRRHIDLALFVTLLALHVVVLAQQPSERALPDLYVISATTSQPAYDVNYPATLYRVDANSHAIRLVRNLLTEKQSFVAVSTDLKSTYYVSGKNTLQIIHLGNPQAADTLNIPSNDGFPCIGAISSASTSSSLLYCAADEAANYRLVRVEGADTSAGTRVARGSWNLFSTLKYQGENGGPFPGIRPLVGVDSGDLVMPFHTDPEVSLAKLPLELKNLSQPVILIASTEDYLALWVPLTGMFDTTISGTDPPHVDNFIIHVLDRKSELWRAVTFKTSVQATIGPIAKLLGDWLTVPIMTWCDECAANPGRQDERASAEEDSLPDIQGQYVNNYALHSQISGDIILRNLRDDREMTLHGGAEDTEILCINSEGNIIYRVNDALFSANISSNKITNSALIVKDPSLFDVHWSFWAQRIK